MVDSAIEIKSLIKDLNINKGDTVMLVSDVSSLLHLYKKKGKIFNINLFILKSLIFILKRLHF